MKTYSQCKISKDSKLQVAWIPSEFAVKGKTVKIKIDGTWDDGYRVEEVYKTESRESVERDERAYKKQRQRTDI